MAWLTSALTALVTCLALQQLVQLWRHRNDLRSVLCSAADDAGVEDGSWSAGQGGSPPAGLPQLRDGPQLLPHRAPQGVTLLHQNHHNLDQPQSV